VEKPSNQEEEWFAREELEKKRQLAREQASRLAEQQQQELKTLHFMKCPKCGFDLHTVKYGPLDIDTCFNCHGVWLDSGELEQIAAKSDTHPVVGAVLNWFRRG
jgi:hypothetical protein